MDLGDLATPCFGRDYYREKALATLNRGVGLRNKLLSINDSLK